MRRIRSHRFILMLATALLIFAVPMLTAAQGRGKGVGRGRSVDVFTNGGRIGRIEGRGRNQDWKCSVFVNCHDARDGRIDGRGPNRLRSSRGYVYGRGANVGDRRRYSTNDYW
ncbi:MAG TPA: hypothetical protein VNG71_08670, partial [Pyrinomonadaceae bacterium]|nr:hypothetical protein [Pyrinomonadaceae bacterium]